MDRNPLLFPEVVLAIGLLVLACSALLLYFLKRQMRMFRTESLVVHDLHETVSALKTEVMELQSRFEGLEQSNPALFDWNAGSGGIHLNRRGQVLRLHRRGDSIAHIASVLGLSNGEVALIVKVQKMKTPESDAEKNGAEL